MTPIRTTTRRILIGLLSGLVGMVYPFFYFGQERLIFLGAAPTEGLLQWARSTPGIRELRLPMADGTRLHGWLLPVEGDPAAPLLIYFGGNAEEVTGVLSAREELPGFALLLVNYRGYGLSEGNPSQAALQSDALAVYDWAVKESGLAPRNLFAWGRSLGSGVAVYLASQRHLSGVVLITPYDSLRAVAQRHYPWVPVSLLLHHPFDSLALAPSLRMPVLALVAEKDRIVPPSHTEALLGSWGGPHRVGYLPGVGHEDIQFGPGYWDAIQQFVHGTVMDERKSAPAGGQACCNS